MPEARNMEDMVEDFLARQAHYRTAQTGESLPQALNSVRESRTGRDLQRLCGGQEVKPAEVPASRGKQVEGGKEGMNDQPILLAEDNPDDVVLTLRVFEKAGIKNRIVVARDGVEALDYLYGVGDYAGRDTDSMPELVLLDLAMPRLNGVDVLRRIRASARTKSLPVLLLAEREDLNVLNGHGLAADAYVRKPLDFTQLSDVERQLGLQWQVKADA